MIIPRIISCDEAGFTGNNMMNPDQPYFSYASTDLHLDEAEDLIKRMREKYKIQMPELKSRKLLKTNKGISFLVDILSSIDGRYLATIYEKRLSLTGKLFEYIYEPVLKENNMIFYSNNLHRFVAMYLYILTIEKPMETLIFEFEEFMRSLDPTKAPTLFGLAPGSEPDQLIGQIIRFARGYNLIIARETRDLEKTGDTGKWILDLTVSAVFSHLSSWGQKHSIIEVVCDDSKPLLALSKYFDVMVNRPEVVYQNALGKSRAITWNMSKPISFSSSKNHAGIQVADIVAGVAAAIPESKGNAELEELASIIIPNFHNDCIMPDFSVVDLKADEAPVNWLILEELASRADVGANPLEYIEEFYEMARKSLPELRKTLR